MSINLVVVKPPYAPEGLDDPLELDADPAFKAADYRKLAEQFCANAVWNGDEGQAEIAGHSVSMVSTDACLFLNFIHRDVTPNVVQDFTVRALSMGVVVMDADSADMLSGDADF